MAGEDRDAAGVWRREARAFAALAIGLAWAAWTPLLLAGAVVDQGRWPTHLPGLLAPAAAALLLSARAGGLGDLRARLRVRSRPEIAAVLMLPPAALLAAAPLLGGDWAGLSRYSGLPELAPLAVAAIVLSINGFGEEIGWRGYLLPRLQALCGPRAGALLTGLVWAFWHLPMLAVLATYREMGALVLLFGFGLGLLAGSLVLAHVAAAAGLAAAAVWHTAFNLVTATDLGGAGGAVLTAVTMVWAAVLLARPAALAVPPPPRPPARPRPPGSPRTG